MGDGMHAAASGIAAEQLRMDAIANDISNVNTAGYEKQRVVFRDLVYGTDGVGAGTAADVVGRSWQQGPTISSDNPLSVAIAGDGFLQVKLADGRTGLTRAGDLQVDAQGRLTTAAGALLEPPITLPKGTGPSGVAIAADGTVSAAGKKLGQIAIVDVPVRAGLQAVGGGVFVATASSGAAAALKGSTLQQGVLEGSNVNLAEAMTELLDAQRSFALQSRVIHTQDELLDIANQIRH
jgi:flagellar basal-body rod protein FlgG